MLVTNYKAGLSNVRSDIDSILRGTTIDSPVTNAAAYYAKLQRESSAKNNQLEVSVNQLESWLNYFSENIEGNQYNGTMNCDEIFKLFKHVLNYPYQEIFRIKAIIFKNTTFQIWMQLISFFGKMHPFFS